MAIHYSKPGASIIKNSMGGCLHNCVRMLKFFFHKYSKIPSLRHTSHCSQTFRKTKHLSTSMTKPANLFVRPAKTQIRLSIRPVWSESLLSAWRNIGSIAIHKAHSEDSADTHADLSLLWVHRSFCLFCRVLSHLYLCIITCHWHEKILYCIYSLQSQQNLGRGCCSIKSV